MTTTTDDAFTATLGNGRGISGDTPWQRMNADEQHIAIFAEYRHLIVAIVHHDGSPAEVNETLHSQVRNLREQAVEDAASRDERIFGLELIEAVEHLAPMHGNISEQLSAAAKKIARRQYNEFLDCGHGPSVASYGPATAYKTHKDGHRESLCLECTVANEKKEMAKSNKHFGYLSGDGKSIGTCIGGILADVTSTKGGDRGRVSWKAVDENGIRWYGVASDGPGSCTTMTRNKGQS